MEIEVEAGTKLSLELFAARAKAKQSKQRDFALPIRVTSDQESLTRL